VNVTSTYDATTGTIQVKLTVSGFNDADVEAYAVYLSNGTTISNDANAVLAGIKDDTASDQCASVNTPVTVSAQLAGVVCTGSTCWGCSVVPSFSLSLLLVLLLAYFQ